MKFSFFDKGSTIDYQVVYFPKGKKVLKNKACSSAANVGTASPEANDNKSTIKNLPKEARRELIKLLNDKNERPHPPVKQTPKLIFPFASRKTKHPSR
jgi:hypothetical protein